MKMRFILIMATAIFSLSPLTQAQCPQICDDADNTALGESALQNNKNGGSNTAIGTQALSNSFAGSFNTALGAFALATAAGSNNTAVGYQALSNDTTGLENTAVGYNALSSVTTGTNNTAVGAQALEANTGWYDTALGKFALTANTTGYWNTASGYAALYSNTTGNRNTAVGRNALVSNTSGDDNIALGDHAGSKLTTERFNIDIAHGGIPGESNTIRIGRTNAHAATYIAGISGKTVAGGVGVLIDSQGHLGTNTSSARFKDAIKPMDKASEAILALQPVTFRYKHELDPDGIPQFGLVAEQVEKVNPDLVARDEQGKPYTVRYEAVNAMLLNEFLKAHRKLEEQGSMIVEQQKEIQALTEALKAQAAQIQKVSDQFKAQVAPRVVVNN